MILAKRIESLGTESAFEVLARAKSLELKGKDIINLGIGQPDFRTPPNIVEAAKKALSDGYHGYTPANGMLPLRESVSADVFKRRGVDINPDRVVIVPGGKVTIFFAALLLGERGTEILYPDPGFPIYRSAIEFSGATAVPMPLNEKNNFSFCAEEILEKITPKTRLIILNSPANPTGSITKKSEIDTLVKGLESFPDLVILSDEIYSRLIYSDQKPLSLISYPSICDRVILLDGWSKTYAMTGWRLGYGIFPKKLYEIAEKLAVNIHSCVNASAQYAALEALTGPQECVEEMNQAFKKRATLMFTKLNEVKGLNCQKPNGAFYCFPNISDTNKNSMEVQNLLLDKIGVATVAGTSFGKHGENYIRLSCANSNDAIEEAISRMKNIF